MSAKSLLSPRPALSLRQMPTVESQEWNQDHSAELQLSSEDENLYDEFDAEGFTREELKEINAIAPPGQTLQDAALHGLEDADDGGIRATRDPNSLWTVEEREWREREEREVKKKKRKKERKPSLQGDAEHETDGAGQQETSSTPKPERQAKRKSNRGEPDRAPKRKKTAAELEQEHWRKIERPARDNKEDQEKQDHIAAIDDEIRGTRDFANAKQLEIYEHGGMPEIDKQTRHDLEEMKKERDTIRDGEELNTRNRKKRKSAVRVDGTFDSKPKRSARTKRTQSQNLHPTDSTPNTAPSPSPAPDLPSTNTRSSSRRHKKPPPPPPPPPPQPTPPPPSTTPPLPPPHPTTTPKPARSSSSTKISPYFPRPPPTTTKPQKSKTPSSPPISCIPFPPLTSPAFGLAQESLTHTPFNLLLSCVFLTKTRGTVAIPVFYAFITRYPTPSHLALASTEDILPYFKNLGLQNQRARRVAGMARAWVAREPRRGMRYLRRGYPGRSDGRGGRGEGVGDEDDDDDNEGGRERAGGTNGEGKGERVSAWEIGHIPGVGAYGLDSWRIFCRDELRGVGPNLLPVASTPATAATDLADDVTGNPTFQPEWQRVIPADKELRAYLRWRWLKEGWVWDPLDGTRRRAEPREMEVAEGGGVMVEGGEEGGEEVGVGVA